MSATTVRRHWVVRPGCEPVRKAIAKALLRERRSINRDRAIIRAGGDRWGTYANAKWNAERTVAALRLVAISTREWIW